MGIRYNPWRQIYRQGVTLRWSSCDRELDGALGWYYPDAHEIVLDKRQSQVERRCTLAHELVHAERRDEPCGSDVLDVRQELVVSKEAARRLLPDIKLVAEVLAWTQDLHEAADDPRLWVDIDTLRVRLLNLHPAERAYLKNRLKEHGSTCLD